MEKSTEASSLLLPAASNHLCKQRSEISAASFVVVSEGGNLAARRVGVELRARGGKVWVWVYVCVCAHVHPLWRRE